ncbi:hypothetical protein C0989_009029, partial [Termitomyces sp. Mn162]
KAQLVPYDDDVPAGDDQRMDKHPDYKVFLSTARPLKQVVAKAGPLKLVAVEAGPSRSATAKAGTVKPATTSVVAANPMVVATPVAFSPNVPQEPEVGMIEVLELRTYIIPTALSHEYFLPVHQDPSDKEFFVSQVQAAHAATGAPVASNSGSNDDNDVPMSEQCILDSESEDNAAEHYCKKQHNANTK